MTTIDRVVLAHGLGGSTDLPIPYTYALIGAAWALTFTFAVVAFAWRNPRFDPDSPGAALPSWVTTVGRLRRSPGGRLRGLALVFAVWVVVAGVFGPQNAGQCAARRVLRAAVGRTGRGSRWLFGPVWRVISPIRTAPAAAVPAGALRRPRWRYPARVGIPARGVGLFAFVWLELASPDPGSLAAVRTWLLVYVVVMLVGALLCGAALVSRGPTRSRCTAWWRRGSLRCAGT